MNPDDHIIAGVLYNVDELGSSDDPEREVIRLCNIVTSAFWDAWNSRESEPDNEEEDDAT